MNMRLTLNNKRGFGPTEHYMTDINQEIKELEATLVSLKAKSKAQEPTLTPISFKNKGELAKALLDGRTFKTPAGTTLMYEDNSACHIPFRTKQDGGNYCYMQGEWNLYWNLHSQKHRQLTEENSMQTKAEQIEELKTTAAIHLKVADRLQQQIEELEKPNQWEPRGAYRIKLLKEDAPTLLTAEAAKKASAAMRTHNRLLAYVDEFGGDWEANWEDHEQPKYCVYYSYKIRGWFLAYHYRSCTSGTVYMSQECAEGLLKKLNSGEVIL